MFDNTLNEWKDYNLNVIKYKSKKVTGIKKVGNW